MAVVRFLLEHGGEAVQGLLDDVGDKTYYKRSPLSYTSFNGQSIIIEMLCLTGRVKAQLRSVDKAGRQNAITLAVDRNHAETIEVLAKFDPDGVDRPDEIGRTPLSAAMWGSNSNQKTVRTLLETRRVDVNKMATNGRTPLAFAAARGRRDLIRILVKEGRANINTITESDLKLGGESPDVREEIRLLKQEIANQECYL